MQAIVRPNGQLTLRGEIFRCAIGARGVLRHKEEGDEATPLGVLPLRRVLYRADRVPPPICAVPVEPIGQDDGWCDDPNHRDYNKMIRLPHDGRHEDLWRRDAVYDIIGVLGWNDAPIERRRGSAIFLHVARPDYAPTQGCVALALRDVQRVLAAGVTELLVLDA
jgi:L,D-peptidoglycan transpeptidase YkuD (ErfK/YbiS/YcfS/YnhG family)